jgi:glycosyltransferase involved in cell wall biosynthesis
MKVLSYIDSLNRGGAETLIMDIAKNITNEDFEYIIVSGKGGDLEEEIRNSNAKYIRLNRRKPVDIKLIKQLREIIRTEEIDIIHSHGDISLLYGKLASIGLNIKKLNTFHGYIISKKEKLIFELLANGLDMNICVSNDFLNELKKEIKIKNAEVIYNGIDDSKFRQNKNKNYLKEYNFGKNNFIAGMVGNFIPGKNHFTLCRAVSIVLEKNRDVKLLFVGRRDEANPEIYDNCYKYCLENNLLSNIIFTGKRNNIPEILSSLDLFILSSDTDTFGIAAVEAMLSKVPCLLSDIPPLKEISDNGKYAILFKKGDEKDLADKILKIIDGKYDIENLTNEAYTWAKENFSIRAHIDNLKKIYQKVLEEK